METQDPAPRPAALPEDPVPANGSSDAGRGARLRQPGRLADMLLYRINGLRAIGGGLVLRYCEGEFGVTRREWVFLALLAEGPAASSELASRAALDKSATSKTVMSLLGKGLISRKSRAGDRRYSEVALTDEGLALHARILPVVDGINRALMADLGEAEVDLLDDMLDRMHRAALRLQADAATWPLADRRHGGSRNLGAGKR